MLSWNPPSFENRNGRLVRYHVSIEESQVVYINNQTVIVIGNNANRTYEISASRTQIIDKLLANRNYTVRIAAATSVGIGPFSEAVTVTTLEDGELLLYTNSSV